MLASAIEELHIKIDGELSESFRLTGPIGKFGRKGSLKECFSLHSK